MYYTPFGFYLPQCNSQYNSLFSSVIHSSQDQETTKNFSNDSSCNEFNYYNCKGSNNSLAMNNSNSQYQFTKQPTNYPAYNMISSFPSTSCFNPSFLSLQQTPQKYQESYGENNMLQISLENSLSNVNNIQNNTPNQRAIKKSKNPAPFDANKNQNSPSNQAANKEGSLRQKFTKEKSERNSNEYSQKQTESNTKMTSNRQLPMRSQNIDLSNFVARKPNDSNPMSPVSSLCSPASSTVSQCFQKNVNYKSKSPTLECSFCKKNGENEEIYLSHNLKDSLGKLSCPILREFKCPKCGESGDYAHTNKYCPVTQRKKKERKIKNCR